VSGWLLDTNVLSELRRASPSRKVSAFVAGQPLDSLYVSAVTFAEIRFGIELVTEPARRSDLTLWLDNKLRPMFDGRILEINEDVLLKWRLIIEDGRKRGHTFSHPDVLIAATAAHQDVTVVTRNVDEFEAAGVAVFNPWTGKTAAAR
jgi:toxin FitB